MKSGETPENKSLSGFHYGLAGAAAGTLTRFLVQPLDVLKITFQLQTTPKNRKETAKYTSILQAFKAIVKEEGVSALWKGHIPAQFLSIIFGAVQFSTYEVLTSYFHNTHPLHYRTPEHLINIGAGSIAGLAATIASFPFDVIKTHLVFQMDKKVYKGTINVVSKVYKEQGSKGFFRGLSAACAQTAPMSGLVFYFHGIFTQLWYLLFIDTAKTDNMTRTGALTTGLFTGFCAKTVVYPFDLMKKRLQIQGFSRDYYISKDMIICSKISECFWITVKNEGVLGLFKGFCPTVIKSGATTALYFTFYNEVCRAIQYSINER